MNKESGKTIECGDAKGASRTNRGLVPAGSLRFEFGISRLRGDTRRAQNRADTGNLEAMVKLADAYLEGGYANEPMPYWPEEALRLYRKRPGNFILRG